MVSTAETIHIVVDSREQNPLEFSAAVTVTGGTLATGDYSIMGLQELASIERKELGDLTTCCGPERDRFKREMHRLAAYPCRGLPIEATLQDILEHRYRSSITPAAVIGTLTSWSTKYTVPVWFAGDRTGAAVIIESAFHTYLRHLAQVLASISVPTAAPRRNKPAAGSPPPPVANLSGTEFQE